jgi:hypothetical protein
LEKKNVFPKKYVELRTFDGIRPLPWSPVTIIPSCSLLFSQEEEPRSERLAGMEALYQIKNIASKLPVEQGKNITRTNYSKKEVFLVAP